MSKTFNRLSTEKSSASQLVFIASALLLMIFAPSQSQNLFAYEPTVAKKYEQAPYIVRLDVTLPQHPAFTKTFVEKLKQGLARNLYRHSSIAVTWSVNIEQGFPQENPLENLHLLPLMVPQNQKLYATDTEKESDKIIATSVFMQNKLFTVKTAEFDAVTNTKTPVIASSTEDIESLSRFIETQTVKVFRPLIYLTNTLDGKFKASLRGGELGWADTEHIQIKPEDYFTVMHLYQDKKGITQRRIPANLTYLKVSKMNRAEMDLALISAFRAPISAVKRKVQIIGIQAKPLLDESPLKFLRNSNQSPCPGAVVRVFEDKVQAPKPGDKPVVPLQTLRTDRYGDTVIKAEKEKQLVYLYPLSGDVVLATIPIVPGSESAFVLQVPDDQLRLGVEAQLSQLNSEMIDIIAARAVLLARLKRYIEKDNFDQYDLIRPQVEQLNKSDDFRVRLNAIKVFGVQSAQKVKNKTVEKRINTMCAESQSLFDKYFGESDFTENLKDLDSQRKAGKK